MAAGGYRFTGMAGWDGALHEHGTPCPYTMSLGQTGLVDKP